MSDLISRQAAIDLLKQMRKDGDMIPWEGKDVFARIRKLPSVQPKRGRWIKISPANIYECSECGKSVMTNDICAYDFCHGCGADMRGEQDDESKSKSNAQTDTRARGMGATDKSSGI